MRKSILGIVFASMIAAAPSAEALVLRVGLSLSPNNEIPFVNSPAYGMGTIEVRTDSGNNTFIKVAISGRKLATAITGLNIHMGATNENGAFVASLLNKNSRVFRRANGDWSIESVAYIPRSAQMDLFLTELLGANVYINVTTTAHPTGELRTQIG
jgi:hypothetical protein